MRNCSRLKVKKKYLNQVTDISSIVTSICKNTHQALIQQYYLRVDVPVEEGNDVEASRIKVEIAFCV